MQTAVTLTYEILKFSLDQYGMAVSKSECPTDSKSKKKKSKKKKNQSNPASSSSNPSNVSASESYLKAPASKKNAKKFQVKGNGKRRGKGQEKELSVRSLNPGDRWQEKVEGIETLRVV